MNTFSVISWSHYLRQIHDGGALPSLDARLAKSSRERFRRIDRFIALAVIGSAECAAGQRLDPNCGLYLGYGVGPMGSNIEVQDQICRERLLPKPFHFVNILGSAAGHHVAKNLGMDGQNLILSRSGSAFQAALSVAAADLAAGIVPQALVGAVEECTLPLAEHRARQGLPADTVMAEGTHWILLQAGAPPAGSIPMLVAVGDSAQADAFVRSNSSTSAAVAFGRCVDRARADRWAAALGDSQLHRPEFPFHDSRDGALITDWLARREAKPLCFISGSDAGRWQLLRLGA